MRRVGFIDMDGVVADLVGPLARVHGKPDQTRENWPATYDLSESLGVPHEAIWRHSWVTRADFWADLPKLPWADELVALAREFFTEVAFLSLGISNPSCFAGKLAWVQRYVPALVGTQKILVSRPGHVLIDDHEENETLWRERGGSAVLVPGPWNRLRGTPDERVIPTVRAGLEACE